MRRYAQRIPEALHKKTITLFEYVSNAQILETVLTFGGFWFERLREPLKNK